MHQVPKRISLRFALLLLACVSTAHAQQSSIVVRVRVVDTAGAPIPDVNVAVLQGLREVLASGATDANGARQFIVPRRTDEYQLTTRRIGFERTDRFFATPRSDTIAIQLEMRRTAQTLAPVTVAERENVKRRRYFVDADAIAASKRPIFDAWDVVRKLRPDMVRGLSGDCPLQNVWVNGRRVQFVLGAPLPAIARRSASATAQGRRAPAPRLSLTGPAGDRSALATIKPEHIAEITYADCFDKSVERLGGQAAVFVILKPGVDFEAGIGSFVKHPVAESLPTSLPPISVIHSAPAPVVLDSALSYRKRILGVFDESTGNPLEGVEVVDLATGTKAVTTQTGTVSLVYLAEGVNKVRLRKAGFADVELELVIAPGSTTPITTVLAPKP